jgi:AcrR family transcriptional regulator
MGDSEKTRKKIVAAVGKLLAEKGFAQVGVNTVAREAGVDKVLIYRYFGSLPELLRHFAAQGGFWPSIAELAGKPFHQFKTTIEAGTALLVGHMRELRSRPLTQEIMRWELHERNELTDELARFREQQGLEIMQLLPLDDKAKDVDLTAVAALIHAGITYLVLRHKTADVYMGLDLTSEGSWLRLSKAVQVILSKVLADEE